MILGEQRISVTSWLQKQRLVSDTEQTGTGTVRQHTGTVLENLDRARTMYGLSSLSGSESVLQMLQ